ncbi:MAG: hypothetical protein ACREDL_01520, partial [Bradyrhizobium sp.]
QSAAPHRGEGGSGAAGSGCGVGGAVMAKARQKAAAVPAKAKPDWGQMSPELRALPNEAWRTFCHALVTGPGGHGKYAAAARAAGLGKDSTTTNIAKLAWKIAHDDRMIAAIASESRRYLRAGHAQAVNALYMIAEDPKNPNQMRAISEILSRTDPVVSKQDISVVHKIVDPDHEALEELRALRQIGATREKLIELFGGNGLARLERLEAADMARRATEAKLIEGEVING